MKPAAHALPGLVATLDADGVPNQVDACLICPPSARIGPLSESERSAARAASPLAGRYEERIDRESAAEVLLARAQKAAAAAEAANRKAASSSGKKKTSRSRRGDSPTEAAVKSFARSFGTLLGKEIMRGVMGVLKRGS